MTHTTNPTLVLGVVVLFGVGAAIHFVRRRNLLKAKFVPSEEISFDWIQRTLHWTIGLGVLGLIITGLPVYLSQFLVNPPVPTPLRFFYWGVQVAYWRMAHIYLALVVVGLVLFHAAWDAYRLKTMPKIKVTRRDIREAMARGRNFLGLSREYLPLGSKYDFFQKTFHWSLIILGAFLLISGLITWEAIRWEGIPLFVWLDRISHPFMDTFIRTGHLVAAMLVFGLVVLHTYFAMLPQNRRMLRAITTNQKRRAEAVRGKQDGAMGKRLQNRLNQT